MKGKPPLFTRENPLLLAHRGCSAEAPENTLPAFALAKAKGIPGVELDVHLCATGEMVVIHDDTVDRTTDGSGRVDELSLEALKNLDAGSWKGAEFTGTRIPLLTEVFDLLGREVIYDIEIKNKKSFTGPLEKKLAEQIKAAGLEDRCIVSSFNPLSLRAFHKAFPSIPVGPIYSDDKEVPPYLRAGQGRFFTRCDFIKPDKIKVKNGLQTRWNELFGWPTLPWTVDDPHRAEELLKKGAAGIISNNPGPLKSLFNLD